MQLSYSVVLLFVAVIGLVTSSPASAQRSPARIPILSLLSDGPIRANGQLYRLPVRQQQSVDETVYGPPDVATTTPTAEELTTTTEMPTTTEPANDELKQDVIAEAEKFDEEGVYYIYHPDGLLQRVVYATRSEDMGYTARLTYKDVEPIKEPIYTYDPETLAFTQIDV